MVAFDGVGFFAKWFQDYLDNVTSRGRDSVFAERLKSDVSSALFVSSAGIDSWFDRELREVFDVPVQDLGLGGGRAAAITEWPWGRLLALRHEAMRTQAPAALSAFLGLPIDAVPELNSSKDRVSSQFTKAFRKTLSISDMTLRAIYDLPYARHLGYTRRDRI
jgi:hypothetical protein